MKWPQVGYFGWPSGGYGCGHVFHVLGNTRPERQGKGGWRQRLYGEDVRRHAAKRDERREAVQYEYGWNGNHHDEVAHEKENVASLEQLLELAAELGVRIFICEMSMDLMGFKREEMIEYPNLTYCGVAKFLEEAVGSKVQLFI